MEYVLDFNEISAKPTDLIPTGTIVKVRLTVRNGGYGADGILSKTRQFETLYLNTMMIVLEGPYATRKIYHRFGIQSPDKEDQWVQKSLYQLRAILESAHNILPTEESEEARAKRKVQNYADFNGLQFWIKVGVESPKNPQYSQANSLQCVITPDWPEYRDPNIEEYRDGWQEHNNSNWPFIK